MLSLQGLFFDFEVHGKPTFYSGYNSTKEFISMFIYLVRNVKTLTSLFVLWTFISIFGTQREHNLSSDFLLSHTTQFLKFGENSSQNSLSKNSLFSQIFAFTFSTKPSFHHSFIFAKNYNKLTMNFS